MTESEKFRSGACLLTIKEIEKRGDSEESLPYDFFKMNLNALFMLQDICISVQDQ